MTTLGKALVIINLIFSLATGALILMVYKQRTNWRSAYEKVENSLKAARADRDTYAQQVTVERNTGEDRARDLNTTITRLQGDVSRINGELAQAKTERDALRATADRSNNNSSAITAELDRRKREVEMLQQEKALREKQLVDAEAQAKRERDRAVGAEINVKTLIAKNQQLMQEMENVYKKTDRAGLGTAVAERPPEDVEGVVLEADRASGLLSISIGSDAGLSPGQKLLVYRLKPKAEYVGKIRILRVEPDKAVARPDGRLEAGPIQKGDTVASNIKGVRG